MEIAAKTLIMIVGLLALGAILVILALQLMGMTSIIEIGKIAQEVKYPEILSGESPGVLTASFTDLDQDEEHTTSTEIACAIARAIKKDFLEYGYSDNRPSATGTYTSLTPIEPKKTIVDRGSFRIKWNENVNNFWAFEDLPESLQESLMVEGVCSDDNIPWSCPTPFLDEECVTEALAHMKVGGKHLCTGIDGKITAGGAVVDFGNNNCGGDKKVADGDDNCKSLCPGKDKIRKWRAPGVASMKFFPVPVIEEAGVMEYETDETWDTMGEWPPFHCKEKKCEPLYAWMLVWNNKKKYYEIDIGRIPEQVDKGRLTGGELLNLLLQEKHKYRHIKSGYPFPELRTKYDITFTPEGSIILSELFENFASEMGKDWNVEIQECWGEECYESDVVKKTWRRVWGKEYRTWPLAPLEYDQSKDNSKKRKQLRNVKIRLDGANEPLNQNHIYRAVLRWWRITIDHGEEEAKCEGVGVNCVWCLEDGGSYVGKRWERDCLAEPDDMGGYHKSEKHTRYQDYTLIIVDLGPTQVPE